MRDNWQAMVQNRKALCRGKDGSRGPTASPSPHATRTLGFVVLMFQLILVILRVVIQQLLLIQAQEVDVFLPPLLLLGHHLAACLSWDCIGSPVHLPGFLRTVPLTQQAAEPSDPPLVSGLALPGSPGSPIPKFCPAFLFGASAQRSAFLHVLSFFPFLSPDVRCHPLSLRTCGLRTLGLLLEPYHLFMKMRRLSSFLPVTPLCRDSSDIMSRRPLPTWPHNREGGTQDPSRPLQGQVGVTVKEIPELHSP